MSKHKRILELIDATERDAGHISVPQAKEMALLLKESHDAHLAAEAECVRLRDTITELKMLNTRATDE